jgi:alkylation response protein AidB-like acyl-CoA dehydrogenase
VSGALSTVLEKPKESLIHTPGRTWRDAKLYEIGAGTSEIRRMLIGRELFAETS